MKEEMTIHKALSELKILDARITKEISGTTFLVANKHSNTKIAGAPVKDFVDQTREKFQSIRTLINRRNAIKRAVTRSNAVTEVTVGGQKYTVAEAIDMKNVGMSHLEVLMETINNQAIRAKALADRENGEKLDQRVEQYVKTVSEGVDSKNLPEDVRRMREDFVASQTVEVVDPIDSTKVVAELNDYIDTFMSEVDAALSVSNALTTVEIEYETC